jgi:hypothetical protein
MISREEQGLLAMFDEARLVTAPLLNLPDAIVEPDAGIVLEHFSEIARASPASGLPARRRSLASLLAEYEGQFIDETLKVQIGALYRNLLEAMNFDGQPRSRQPQSSGDANSGLGPAQQQFAGDLSGWQRTTPDDPLRRCRPALPRWC